MITAEVKEELKRHADSDDRPKLTDPKEWALIRSIHFEDHRPRGFDLDPLEALDRQVQGKNRNQSR